MLLLMCLSCPIKVGQIRPAYTTYISRRQPWQQPSQSCHRCDMKLIRNTGTRFARELLRLPQSQNRFPTAKGVRCWRIALAHVMDGFRKDKSTANSLCGASTHLIHCHVLSRHSRASQLSIGGVGAILYNSRIGSVLFCTHIQYGTRRLLFAAGAHTIYLNRCNEIACPLACTDRLFARAFWQTHEHDAHAHHSVG